MRFNGVPVDAVEPGFDPWLCRSDYPGMGPGSMMLAVGGGTAERQQGWGSLAAEAFNAAATGVQYNPESNTLTPTPASARRTYPFRSAFAV